MNPYVWGGLAILLSGIRSAAKAVSGLEQQD